MNSLPREWGCYDGFPEISDGRKLLPSKAGKHRRRWSYRTRGWAQQTQEPGRAARRAPLPRCLPSGARARGAEGPRSRPGTSGELSPQSCFLCMRGPLWLGPLFKGMLTFAWVDDAWTCGNRQTPPGSQQVTSLYDTHDARFPFYFILYRKDIGMRGLPTYPPSWLPAVPWDGA